jgi:1-acyl-sn-glycerol-3-phosphate acyltransferase
MEAKDTELQIANKMVKGPLYYFLRGIALLFIKLYFRIEVVGVENVPTSGPLIIAPSHRSNIDFLLMAPVTRVPIRFMAKDSLFKIKVFAKILNYLGSFAVIRNTSDRSSLKIASQVLKNKDALVVFPEGTRKEGSVIKDIFDGVAYLSIKNNTPIVPVGIGNSDKAMKKGAKFIKPVKIKLVIGKPIYPMVNNSTIVKRSLLVDLTQVLQSELQSVFDKANSLP